MTITVSSELEGRLRERAANRGEDPTSTVEALLRFALSWEEADRLEAIEGVERGMEASRAGRVLSASEVFAKIKRQDHTPLLATVLRYDGPFGSATDTDDWEAVHR